MKKIYLIVMIMVCGLIDNIHADKVYVSDDNVTGAVSIFNTTTNTITGQINDPDDLFGKPKAIAYTPDGKTAYIASFNGNPATIVLVDVQTDTATKIVTDSIGFTAIYALAVTPDGKKMYVVGDIGSISNNAVGIVDLASNTLNATVGFDSLSFTFDQPRGIVITPDGTKAYITNLAAGSGFVNVIDVARDKVFTQITYTGMEYPEPIAITPDGTTLYVGSSIGGSQALYIMDVATDAVEEVLTNANINAPFKFALSPDSSTLYISNQLFYGNNNITVFNTATKEFTSIVSDDNQNIQALLYSSDGKTVYTANNSIDTISIINTEQNAYDGTVNDPNNIIQAPSFLAAAPSTQAPTSSTGLQIQNIFLTQTELVNIISWQAPSSLSTTPVRYTIYRDAALTDNIGTVSPKSTPMTFWDHDRSAGVTYTYYIVATDQYGSTSQPAVVTVKPIT